MAVSRKPNAYHYRRKMQLDSPLTQSTVCCKTPVIGVVGVTRINPLISLNII